MCLQINTAAFVWRCYMSRQSWGQFHVTFANGYRRITWEKLHKKYLPTNCYIPHLLWKAGYNQNVDRPHVTTNSPIYLEKNIIPPTWQIHVHLMVLLLRHSWSIVVCLYPDNFTSHLLTSPLLRNHFFPRLRLISPIKCSDYRSLWLL